MTNSLPEPRFGVVVEHPGIRGLKWLVLGMGGATEPFAIGLTDVDRGLGESVVGVVHTISWKTTDGWIVLDPGIEP